MFSLTEKNDQAEIFRKRQIPKEEEAATTALREDTTLFKEVAKQEAELAKQKKDKKERRAAMLQSISAHLKARPEEKGRA